MICHDCGMEHLPQEPEKPPLAPGEAICPTCKGSKAGKFLGSDCEVCGGTGTVPAGEAKPMASVYLYHQFRVFTTPAALRALADKMQQQWDSLVLGETLEVATWGGKEGEIVFVIDQEKMGEKQP